MKNFKDKLIESAKDKGYEEPLFNEEEMTSSQKAKKEKIVIAMKDKESYFKKKYGKRWKEVMHATATKQAMAEELGYSDEVEELDEGDCVSKPEAKKIAKKEVGKHEKEMHREDVDSSEITTDMLQGRVAGGKDNSFKKFKVKLKGDGVVRPKPEDSQQQTAARSSIEAHGGPVAQPQIKVGEEVEIDENLSGDMASFLKSKGMNVKVTTTDQKKKETSDLMAKRAADAANSPKPTPHHDKEKYPLGGSGPGNRSYSESKDPTMDAGCGSAPDFVTNGSQKATPLSRVKDLARKSLNKVKTETLGIAPSNQ